MKTHFDWQTETDERPSQRAVETTPPSPTGRRHQRIAAAIIVLAVTYLLISLVEHHNDQVAQTIGDEVLHAFSLQMQAARNGDVELFSLLTMPTDRSWKIAQQSMYASQPSEDHTAPLRRNNADLPKATIRELSPDLTRAEVLYSGIQYFESVAGDGRKITLEHTVFYEKVADRWLLSPPDQQYWGPWNESHSQLVSITYPLRDKEIAQRMLSLADAAIRDECRRAAVLEVYPCSGDRPLRIKLSTNVQSIAMEETTGRSTNAEFDYELPAPSLLGLPASFQDYEFYVASQLGPILQQATTRLATAIRLPDQNIYALCFAYPMVGRHLYVFDLKTGLWQPLLVNRTFTYLSALPDDSAVLLHDGLRLLVMTHHDPQNSATDFRYWYWQREHPLKDGEHLDGWIGSASSSQHLLRSQIAAGESSVYHAVDLNACRLGNCSNILLPGFPLRSNGGNLTLYQHDNDLFLDDNLSRRYLGNGYSPFWMSDEIFGYVKFSGVMPSGLTNEIVVGHVGNLETSVLLDSRDLEDAAGMQQTGQLFINEVMPYPHDPMKLLVASRGVRAYAGWHYVFSVTMPPGSNDGRKPQIEFEFSRDGAQVGIAGQDTPTGTRSFMFSADGRWIASTELKSREKEWTVVVHDLRDGNSIELEERIPAMPGSFALLDWSADGQWLLIADRDDLQLIAPHQDRRESINHEFDLCTHIAWAN